MLITLLVYYLDTSRNLLLDCQVALVDIHTKPDESRRLVCQTLKSGYSLTISPERINIINARHEHQRKTLLCSIELTEDEMRQIEVRKTIRELLEGDVDWTVLGKVFEGISKHRSS